MWFWENREDKERRERLAQLEALDRQDAEFVRKNRPTVAIMRYKAGDFPTTYMTPEGKALKEQYFYEAKAQWRGPALSEDVQLHVRFYFRTNRRRDLDNMNKLILDVLTGIVYADDHQANELHLYRDYDPQRPRIEITIH